MIMLSVCWLQMYFKFVNLWKEEDVKDKNREDVDEKIVFH